MKIIYFFTLFLPVCLFFPLFVSATVATPGIFSLSSTGYLSPLDINVFSGTCSFNVCSSTYPSTASCSGTLGTPCTTLSPINLNGYETAPFTGWVMIWDSSSPEVRRYYLPVNETSAGVWVPSNTFPSVDFPIVLPLPTLLEACNSLSSEILCLDEIISCEWDGDSCEPRAYVLPVDTSYGFADTDFGYLGNMLRDVVVFLFFPSRDNVTAQFNAIANSYSTKIPFAYLSAFRTLWITSASSLEEGDYPVISEPNPFGGSDLVLMDFDATRTLIGGTLFDNIRLIIGYLLWIGAFLFIWETIHAGNTSKL